MQFVGLAIAIAVEDVDEASKKLKDLLGLESPVRATAQEHGVEVATFNLGDGRLQLISPIDDSSPIAKFLEDSGPGIHHMGVLVNQLGPMVEHLREIGTRTLGEPMPGAEGLPTVFLHPRETLGALVELLEVPSSDSN